jgi:hypothetical protein
LCAYSQYFPRKHTAVYQRLASDGAPQEAERSYILVHDNRGGYMVDVRKRGICARISAGKKM